MLKTLRQRDFSLLWLAGMISFTGNWMMSIALPIIIYTMTGSALAIGGMLLARTLPAILFSSVAGVFVDRWERRFTIVAINLLLALSILPLLLVQSADWLWLIYVVTFVQSTLSQFLLPAENALLPLLSDSKLLVSANALNALNNNLARLVGPALGGLLLPLLGLSGVVVVDAMTFLVAGLLAGLISVTSHPGKSNSDDNTNPFRKVAKQWSEGLKVIWHTRTVRILFFLNILPALGESTMYVLFVPFVTEILKGGAFHVGDLMSAQAVGGILGGMVIGWVSLRVKTYRLLGVSAMLIGCFDLVIFNYPTFLPGVTLAYMMFVLAGPASIGFGAGYATMIQTHVDDAYRGRVFGTMTLLASIFTLAGIAVAGFAGDQIGIVPVINTQVIAYLLFGLICLLMLREKQTQVIATPEAN